MLDEATAGLDQVAVARCMICCGGCVGIRG